MEAPKGSIRRIGWLSAGVEKGSHFMGLASSGRCNTERLVVAMSEMRRLQMSMSIGYSPCLVRKMFDWHYRQEIVILHKLK